MLLSAPDEYYIHTLRRERVDVDLDLVGHRHFKILGAKAGGSGYWGYQTPLGIFLQRRARPEATDSGAAALDNGTIHKFFVDETAAGKLELTESLLPPQR